MTPYQRRDIQRCWRDNRRSCLKPNYFQRCEAQGKACQEALEKYPVVEIQVMKLQVMKGIRGMRL